MLQWDCTVHTQQVVTMVCGMFEGVAKMRCSNGLSNDLLGTVVVVADSFSHLAENLLHCSWTGYE